MPKLAKIPRWLQHLIFWVEVVGWYYIQYQVLGEGEHFARRMWVVMPVDILAACVSSYLLVDQLLLKAKYIWFLVALAASMEMFIALERLLEYHFLLPLTAPESLSLGFWHSPSIFNIGVRIYLIVSLFAGMRLFKFWLLDQSRKQALEQQNLQTELAMLRSQIQPHFLFNTLNNIDALVHADPDKASEAIARLSEILRFQLYEKANERISLREEIDFLEATIALLELRRRGTEGIDFKVRGQTEAYYMPALLLAPFVENAYKHGDKQAPINIRLETKDDRLYFEIENSLKASTDNNYQSIGGLGLANVKRRFDLYFETDYELTYGTEGQQFVLRLQMPLFHQALNT